MYWARGHEMQKVTKMEIHRKADISVTGRAVAEDEWDKMLDRKMQEKKLKRIDIAHER